ncbi:GntR family transcriptional regulator [Streptomyces sp. SM8]|uniref:GntR family transcriptional regulator n=1 Tax=Streptomyces sp. SM8 TaxID=1195457 RepID=UPI0002830E6B|nr:GntR family transcriptional regulator [Streptomyces sp. SM8]PKA32904.1 GntR family transcriptional regulator [Streptomyces sp. SM8]
MSQALPPYRRIAEKIITDIEAGRLRPGDRAPSVREIERAEGVSAATAARVTAVLRDRGYVDTVPGIGTIVRTPSPATAGAERLTRMLSARPSIGEGERVELLDVRREEADRAVADALGVEVGTVVARRRRRYLDVGGVVAVSSTWVTGALADLMPEYEQLAPLPKMTFGLVEERTGRRVARRRDTHEVRPVPLDVAEHLGVPAGTEVLATTNHYWDQRGEPTEYAVDYLAPGRRLVAECDV